MKKLTILGLVGVMVFTTSCKVFKTTKSDYDVMYITKTGIVQRPLVADLQVSEKRQTLTKTYDNTIVTEAKENIVADFIRQYNCDLAVQPFLSTTTTSSGSSVTVTISAYTGTYKNMRDFQTSDTMYIKIIHSLSPRDASSDPGTKNKVIIAPKKA